MRDIEHLTTDQLRELLSRPLSKEATEQLMEVGQRDRGLLVSNLRRAEGEIDVEQNADHLTCEEISALLFGKVMDEEQLDSALKVCRGVTVLNLREKKREESDSLTDSETGE